MQQTYSFGNHWFFFTLFANEDIKAIEKLTELQEKSNKNDRSRLCSCFFPLFRCVRSNKLISNQLNTSAFCIYVNIYTMWNAIKKSARISNQNNYEINSGKSVAVEQLLNRIKNTNIQRRSNATFCCCRQNIAFFLLYFDVVSIYKYAHI